MPFDMDFAARFLTSFFSMALESAPFLLAGLILAGCLVALLPTSRLNRWLNGHGPWPVLKAALLGVPLPLCSCSVVPVATGLRRGGASPGATISFLISTPENGPDSLAVSYALLGPVMTVARPLAALCSAVTAGLLAPRIAHGTASTPKSCGCCGHAKPEEKPRSLAGGLRYAFSSMLDDLLPWLAGGVVAAAVLTCLLPPESMAAWGSGLGAKFAMVAIGVPMYVCASASTPIAASLLAAGISPGTVLVFLLAGPATNLGTVAIVYREMGKAALSAYLIGAALVPIVCGVALDAVVGTLNLPIATPHAAHGEHGLLSALSLGVLLFFAVKPLRKRLLGV